MGRLLAAGLLVLGNLYVLWGPSTHTPPGDNPLLHREVTRYGVFGYRVVEMRTPMAGSWCLAPGRQLAVGAPAPVEVRSTSALVVTALATGPVLALAGFLARRAVSS
jgi:hypothetical protein